MSATAIADRIARRIRWNDLDPKALDQLIHLARAEDLSGWGLAQPPGQTGDVTTAVLQEGAKPASARLVAREEMVVCGLPLIPRVLMAYGEKAQFDPSVEDGDLCPGGCVLGTLTGPSQLLLECERVMLNFLQRLSGIASLTRCYVEAMGDTPTRLLDTRKTTPGYRVLEKYAVACGGGFNHRIGLFDRVMLKDNHLAASRATQGRDLRELAERTRKRWPQMVIELEVDRLSQIPPGLEAGVDIFLLDNFPTEHLRQAIDLIGDRAASEASGGITLESLPGIAHLGLDFISTGAIVHQATWKDIGLDWVEAGS